MLWSYDHALCQKKKKKKKKKTLPDIVNASRHLLD